MKIIIATENEAKNKGVKDAFLKAFPNENLEFISEGFESNVKVQPTSEEEGVLGAINRANNAKQKHAEADFYIGMEGFVDSNEFGMFLAGSVVIIDKNENKGIGFSAKVQLPNFMRQRIDKGEELGPLVKELMHDDSNNIRHGSGTNGILTKDLYSRSDEFYDATVCALAKYITPDIYSK